MRSRMKVPSVAGFMSVIVLALLGAEGLAFAQGSGAPLGAGQQPWAIPQPVTPPPGLFETNFDRVIRDTRATLESFANLSRYGAPGKYTPAMQVNVSTPVWIPDARTYVAPDPDQPRIMLGPLEAALVPIEVASTVVAESRGMQAVLVGLQVRMPWRIP